MAQFHVLKILNCRNNLKTVLLHLHRPFALIVQQLLLHWPLEEIWDLCLWFLNHFTCRWLVKGAICDLGNANFFFIFLNTDENTYNTNTNIIQAFNKHSRYDNKNDNRISTSSKKKQKKNNDDKRKIIKWNK